MAERMAAMAVGVAALARAVAWLSHAASNMPCQMEMFGKMVSAGLIILNVRNLIQYPIWIDDFAPIILFGVM